MHGFESRLGSRISAECIPISGTAHTIHNFNSAIAPRPENRLLAVTERSPARGSGKFRRASPSTRLAKVRDGPLTTAPARPARSS